MKSKINRFINNVLSKDNLKYSIPIAITIVSIPSIYYVHKSIRNNRNRQARQEDIQYRQNVENRIAQRRLDARKHIQIKDVILRDQEI